MKSTDNERSMVKAILEEIGWLGLMSLPGVVETGEGFEEHHQALLCPGVQNQIAWVQIQISPITSHMTLGKLFKLSWLRFLTYKMRILIIISMSRG